MMTALKKAGLPALVLLGVLLVFTGCLLDLGVPRRNDGQQSQPAGGVLTVKGVKNGTHHEAAVYDYPDDDVADAADLKDLMSRFELVAVGLGTAGNKTLALGLVTLDGDYFTADGDFLVVIKQVTKDDSAPFKYKAAVPFSGGNATVEYNDMETATRLYTVTFDLNYTDAPSPPKPQEIDADSKVTPPDAPVRTGYALDGWFLDAAKTTKWDFDTDTVKKDITLYAKWKPLTLAAAITDMAETANSTSANYTLPSGDEAYNAEVTLTTANSPASVTIDGGNRVVTGSTNRITIGSGVTITLKNITFKTLPFTVSAGGTLILGNEGDAAGSAAVQGNTGTGISVSGGTLEMNTGALVTGNGDSGVRMEGIGGVFTMTGGTISDNTVPIITGEETTGEDSGGGVAMLSTGGVFTMSGGTISGNTASNDGGGVFMGGTDGVFTMSGGTISGNSTDAYGGGVAISGSGAKFDMSGGAISGNTSFESGGGVVLLSGAAFTMSGGEISGNIARGGLYPTAGGVGAYDSDTVFTMLDGKIYGNKSKTGGGGVTFHGGHFIMKGGEIYGNETNIVEWGNNSRLAYYGGGGAYVYQAVFDMEGGKIYSNIGHLGGGVYVYNSTFNMTGGEITGNSLGGGVHYVTGGISEGNPTIGGTTPTVSGGWIHGNTPYDRN